MIPATIHWFDGKSGEGMVRLNDGRLVYVHFTAFAGVSSNNYQWPTDADQQRLSDIDGHACLVEVMHDTTFTQVSKLILTETK